MDYEWIEFRLANFNLWPFNNKEKLFTEERNVFSENYLELLKEKILASPYLAKNHLNYNFSTTLGFSVIFKPGKISELTEKFPFFAEYIHKVFLDEIDVYYLNPLLLKVNSKVERHIDHSLRSYDPGISFPYRVSVLYVDVPVMRGGELMLYKNDRSIARLKPERNKLVYFEGSLKHEIKEVKKIRDNTALYRISLVCEQYKASGENLEKVPDFLIRSAAGFKNFLDVEL